MKILRSKYVTLFLELLLLAVPAGCFYGVECFTHNPWTTIEVPVQLWNILLFQLFFLALYLIIGRVKPALILGILFFVLTGTANYYVVEFRANPIVPWDLFAFRTAMSVAGGYSYVPTLRTVLIWMGFLAMLVYVILVSPDRRLPSLKLRLGLLLGTCALLAGYVYLISQVSFIRKMNMSKNLFKPYLMAETDGLYTAFLMDIKYLITTPPQGYDRSEMLPLSEPVAQEDIPSAEELPNIVVIMNEAFSDLSVLGPFDTGEDYMPYMHSAMAGEIPNCETGWLNVSIKGGNTANTEFEFLTGNSMYFQPAGSVPYQQQIHGEQNTLVSHLKSLGYSAVALHPYGAKGWNRSKVYEYFGFEQFISMADFREPELVRKFISDRECYRKINDVITEHQDRGPLFLFTVTVQNHGGYTEDFENFTPDVKVKDVPKGKWTNQLHQYLSLMKISDQALEELMGTLADSRRDTIVVFFGDHQPTDTTTENIWRLNGSRSSSLTEQQELLRYKVPYLIWSTRELMGTAVPEETSANYLAAQILRMAELPLARWQEEELQLAEDMPILTTMRIDVREDAGEDKASLLNRYQKIQYYKMHDECR